MKKLLAILLGACLLLGVMTGCGGNAEDAVTVQKVSDITSQGSVGLVNRYAGIVVSGETATVKKGDKKVLETYVKEGDFVTEGDVLFCYDNEAMELQLSKLLLELEAMRTRSPTPRRTSPISSASATPPPRRSSSPTRCRSRSCRRTCVKRPITRASRSARSRICRKLSRIRTCAHRSPAA